MIAKNISYRDGDTELQGYFAYDDSKTGKRPGILVAPEWWGLNDYIRGRTEQLAGLGYAVFAIDMYGAGRIADTVEDAKAFSAPFFTDNARMRHRAAAGLDVLKRQPETDGTRLAAIGYCFGGTISLELARAGADILAAVSFHGGLSTECPALRGVVKAQVLALNGGDDPFVPQEQKDAFIKEMTAAEVAFHSIDYPGTTHAFTNPAATERGKKFNLPLAYDAEADQKSWEEMKKLFNDVFC
jgi:dienelactone hydrolase